MKYIKAHERRQQLLQIACDLAEADHYRNIRRDDLVKAGETPAGNVSRIMGGMDGMRTALIKCALENDRFTVVAQAIIDKHPAVQHLCLTARMNILLKAA